MTDTPRTEGEDGTTETPRQTPGEADMTMGGTTEEVREVTEADDYVETTDRIRTKLTKQKQITL